MIDMVLGGMNKTIGKTIRAIERIDEGKCWKLSFDDGYLVIDVCSNPAIPVGMWYDYQ